MHAPASPKRRGAERASEAESREHRQCPLIPESQLPVSITESAFDVPDLVQRATGGRNPFSNIGVRYTGSTDVAQPSVALP